MKNRKIIGFIIVILLIFSSILPTTIGKVKIIKIKESNQEKIIIDNINAENDLPEFYYDLSKAPSYYDLGDKLFAEEFNFPIGSFGNNYISYGPHGIDRIALYNNFYDAFGGTQGTGADSPQSLNGTFLGVYVDDGTNKTSRILQKFMPTERGARSYGLNPVDDMDCYSNIPIGYYRYYDSDISCELGLNVFSPVILNDVKNSSIPVSIWNFNAYNPTDETVEVSFLFSLENDIGWRNSQEIKIFQDDVEKTAIKYNWQRTGTYNYIEENDEMVGVKFSYDESMMSKSRPEYLGNMTLATKKQEGVKISYVSEWDTLGNGDELLSSFTSSGELSNQNNNYRAVEGESIFAGALSAKITLSPGEGKEVPFVLSTCFPTFNLSNITGMHPVEFHEWYWTQYFDDSRNIATYSLENYEVWWDEINKWHDEIYSSGLSSDTTTFLIGSLSVFVSCVFFSDQGYWFTAHSSLGYLETLGCVIATDWFLCMFYPEIIKYRITKSCIDVNSYEEGHLWEGDLDLHLSPSFVIRAYRGWIWNQGDEKFLQMVYQNCSRVMDFAMNLETYNKKEGLIHNRGNDQIMDWWIIPTSSYLNSLWLLSLKCMKNMAEELGLYNDAEFYEEEYLKAKNSFIKKFWVKTLKHGYFKLCADKIGKYGWWYYPDDYQFPIISFYIPDTRACMIDQIQAIWFGRLFDEDILPSDKTSEALSTIYQINRDYCHNLGWISSVMGSFPHRIDRFSICINDMPSSIHKLSQWFLATSLLSHGFTKEALTVSNLTVDNYLYNKGGGIYVTHKHNDSDSLGFGTNKINVIKTWRTLKSRILMWLINAGKFGDKEWKAGDGYYPNKISKDLPSWSLYQAASGFTPCIGGLKVKPLIGGYDVFYFTIFAGCRINMNVTGNGDTIKSVLVNEKPYCNIIDGQVFLPIEKFKGLNEMFVEIILN